MEKQIKPSKISFTAPDLERKVELRPIDLGLFTRLFGYTRAHATRRNILFVLVFIRSAQLPVLTWIIGAVIDGPISSGDNSGILAGVAGFLIFSIFTQIVFHYRMLGGNELGELVINDLRNDLFSHILKMQMSFFAKTKLGRIISRFTSDAEAVRSGIQNVVFVSLVQGGNMIVASIMMILLDWKIFLVLTMMAPVIWGINRIFRLRLINAYRDSQESFSRVTATVAESIKGVKIIQSYSREDLNSEIFRDLAFDHSGYNLKIAQNEGVFLPLLELNTQFFLSVILLVGTWRILGDSPDFTTGKLIQFIFLSNFFFGPIQTIANQYNQALTAMSGAERVFNFLDRKPDWNDAPDSKDIDKIRGDVKFTDVTFSYLPGRPVLKNIDFSVSSGMTVALVGATGSGKTTITSLVSKFYIPDSGTILVDGRDTLEISSHSLRKHIGIVLQVNFLFSGTVMDNILLGRPGAKPEDALEAARKIDCLDVLESLPMGFETRVGENGVGLSLGQKQLICFSRAMLADPKILILDEATSSVDAITEYRLKNALSKLLAGRTSFVVAHRLSTIKNANLVLVLEHGRIAERGTHHELLKKNGIYAGLYKQFRISSEI